MKRILVVLFIFCLCSFVEQSEAQALGTRYLHSDTLSLATGQNDTTWTNTWETVTMWSSGEDVLLRIGASDVGSWTSRVWITLPGGSSLTIGPAPKLKRLTAKTSTGTSTLYLVGTKKVAQY